MRSLIVAPGEVVMELDAATTVLNVWAEDTSLLPRPAADLVGRSVLEFFSAETIPSFTAAFQRVMETAQPEQAEFHNVPIENRWCSVGFSRIPSANGKELCLCLRIRDITEQKQADTAFCKSEVWFRAVFENSLDAICVTKAGVHVLVNPAYCALFGYSAGEELIGKPVLDLVAPSEREKVHGLEHHREAGEPALPFYEIRAITRDGTERDVEIHASTYVMEGETYTLAVIRDIDERKRIETEIRNLNRVYAVLSNINQAIVRLRDRQQLFDRVCRIAVRDGNFKLAWVGMIDPATRRVNVVAHDGNSDGYVEALQISVDDSPRGKGPTARAIREGKHFVCNDIATDERMRPWREAAMARGFRSSAAFPLTVLGTPIGVINLYAHQAHFFNEQEVALLDELAIDISFALESIHHEEEGKRAEELNTLLAQTLKSVQDCVSITDLDDTLIFVNEAFLRTYGYENDEVIGKNVAMIRSSASDPAQAGEILPETIRGSWHGELMNRRKDGTEFPIELWTSIVKDSAGKPIAAVGVARDITERKHAEEELRRREERFRKLIENASDIITLIDGDGIILYESPAVERVLGYAPDELLGMSMLSIIHPEDVAAVRKEFDRAMQVPDVSSTPVIFRLMHKDGSWRYLETMGRSIVDESGSVVGVINSRDITEQKKLEAEIVQATKMESLGTLAGGIAHDFNNILAIILGHASLLGEGTMLEPSKQTASIDSIKRAGERGAGLVRQLLTFARKTESLVESVHVNHLIEEIVRLLGETFPKTIVVDTDLADALPPVLGDASQLHQVILNLCVNARDAMPKGGTLTISTTVVPLNVVQERFLRADAPEYVRMSIVDTGIGMDERTRRRVFEPFFTTKERGKGTGLGLAVVYGIVENHGGYIDLKSEPGKGTTFSIFLPKHDQEIEEPRQPAPSEEPLGGSETILFIEDEEMLRIVVQVALEQKGYTILVAADGEEALRTYAEHHGDISLVISDVGLPKMRGDQVYYRMKGIDPAANVILASGYLEPNEQSDLLKAGVKEFIQKPYDLREILGTIRRVLDAR